MSYDTLERQIRMLPEDCLEDVSQYIEFVIYRMQLRKEKNQTCDMSSYFGILKNTNSISYFIILTLIINI